MNIANESMIENYKRSQALSEFACNSYKYHSIIALICLQER